MVCGCVEYGLGSGESGFDRVAPSDPLVPSPLWLEAGDPINDSIVLD